MTAVTGDALTLAREPFCDSWPWMRKQMRVFPLEDPKVQPLALVTALSRSPR